PRPPRPTRFPYTTLFRSTPLWTCWRVAHLMEEEFGISYHAGHVWKIVRQLNWSVQRPMDRALERNEAAIEKWKKQRWPGIKKTRDRKSTRLNSSHLVISY